MDEKSKASKFVSFLIKISFLPISIEDDVIKFKIAKAVVHILVYPGLCITNFLFVTFYFKKWMSNILIPNYPNRKLSQNIKNQSFGLSKKLV